MPVAHGLFESIGAATGDGVGMAREPYSANEQKASDLLEAKARKAVKARKAEAEPDSAPDELPDL